MRIEAQENIAYFKKLEGIKLKYWIEFFFSLEELLMIGTTSQMK